mmetsp:Transcript_75041/g.214975  ORF Transcript_75041/g.214975 Transcript_75041/m.214975 type:complete len:267 (-) Transcript_75041:296-1096(-)
MMKLPGRYLMTSKFLFLTCALSNLEHHCSELPPTIAHSSSSIGSTPVLLALMSSTMVALSGKSCGSHFTPSRAYSIVSFSKITSLKYCCNNSLVKLMKSCSSEFRVKNSKPKMSSTPTNGRASPFALPLAELIVSLTLATTKANTAPYKCRARASLLSAAFTTVTGMLITLSPGACMVFLQRAVASSLASTSRSSQQRATASPWAAASSAPSELAGGAVNCRFPKCSTAMTAPSRAEAFLPLTPKLFSATKVVSKSLASSTPGASS